MHEDSNIYMSTFCDRVLERIGIATDRHDEEALQQTGFDELNNQTKDVSQ